MYIPKAGKDTEPGLKVRKSKFVVPTSADTSMVRSGGRDPERVCHITSNSPSGGGEHEFGNPNDGEPTKSVSRHVPAG
jgi:hypothetical protein